MTLQSSHKKHKKRDETFFLQLWGSKFPWKTVSKKKLFFFYLSYMEWKARVLLGLEVFLSLRAQNRASKNEFAFLDEKKLPFFVAKGEILRSFAFFIFQENLYSKLYKQVWPVWVLLPRNTSLLFTMQEPSNFQLKIFVHKFQTWVRTLFNAARR